MSYKPILVRPDGTPVYSYEKEIIDKLDKLIELSKKILEVLKDERKKD